MSNIDVSKFDRLNHGNKKQKEFAFIQLRTQNRGNIFLPPLRLNLNPVFPAVAYDWGLCRVWNNYSQDDKQKHQNLDFMEKGI